MGVVVTPMDLARCRIHVCEHLIAAVEAGVASDLSIVEVPADIEWVITEYDGAETVCEAHRVFPGGRQSANRRGRFGGTASTYGAQMLN